MQMTVRRVMKAWRVLMPCRAQPGYCALDCWILASRGDGSVQREVCKVEATREATLPTQADSEPDDRLEQGAEWPQTRYCRARPSRAVKRQPGL